MDAKQTIAHIKNRLHTKTPQTEMLRINTSVAEFMLELNWEGNRNVADATVERYANEMKHGNWLLTGEPMIISTDGKVIDGQHRLWAVIQSDTEIQCAVTFGIAPEAFRNINCGRARPISYRAGIPPTQAGALNYILKLGYGQSEVSEKNLRILAQIYLQPINEIVKMQSRNVSVLRQSAIVAAAALWYKAGMGGYVTDMYAAMIQLDSGSLPPVGKSFLRQCVEASSGGKKAQGLELFVRAFRTFDPQAAQVARLQTKSGIPTLEQAREMIQKAMRDAGLSFDAKPVETVRGVKSQTALVKKKKPVKK